MQLQSHAEENLYFSPFRQWPKGFPPLKWRGLQLTPLVENSIAIELDPQKSRPLEEIILGLYPQLRFTELAWLYRNLRELNLLNKIPWEDLVSYYGFRWTQQMQLTVDQLLNTPLAFQEWCFHKDIKSKDLAPLRGLNDAEQEPLKPQLIQFAQANPSKSNGATILEWLIDLHLMKRTPSIDLWMLPVDQLLEALRAQRFPMTSQADQKSQDWVIRQRWPNGSRAQWIRSGDETELEVSIRGRSFEDLQKKLKAVQATIEQTRSQGSSESQAINDQAISDQAINNKVKSNSHDSPWDLSCK